jgi:hypothetical protein
MTMQRRPVRGADIGCADSRKPRAKEKSAARKNPKASTPEPMVEMDIEFRHRQLQRRQNWLETVVMAFREELDQFERRLR